jgi:HK97 family phage portal protein
MLNNLFGAESRALNPLASWVNGDYPVSGTEAGAYITQDSSLAVSTVFSCVNLISSTIAALPVDAYTRFNGNRVPLRPRPEWVMKPDVENSRIEHFQQVIVSLLLDGNAFVRVFRKGGKVVSLVALDPTAVRVDRVRLGTLKYYYNDQEIKAEDILHIRDLVRPGQLRGVSRVEELKEEIGLASALRSFAARFFGQGATAQLAIETTGAQLTPEQAKGLADSVGKRHGGYRNAHKAIVLNNATVKKVGTDPSEAQMVEARRLAVENICAIFGVSPTLIGVTTPGAMSYASVEQNTLNFVKFCLQPIIQKLEEAYSSLIVLDAGFMKFSLDALLRADYATRVAGYSSALQAGWMSINDVRAFEDMRPADGGDVYRVPLANVNVSAADLVETDKKVTMAQKLIQVGFDPASVMEALGLPAVAHSGVPSVMLQGVAQIDPNAPESVYGA